MQRAATIIRMPKLPEPDALPGFNFTYHMRRLCVDLATRLPELSHIDMDRVAVSYSQARKAVRHGLQATLTPLRFVGGSLYCNRRGRRLTLQRVYDSSGTEMLYVVSFYLPRFLECPLREKLVTTVHELWHIGPQFDGDLRRHPGRCYAHSSSQRDYDAAMEVLVDKWLAADPPAEVYGFLQDSFRQLIRRHGHVYGLRVPAPKLLPALSQDHAA